MVVCHCRRVTQRTIETSVTAGARNARAVVATTRAGTGCGGCLSHLRELIEAQFGRDDHASATA